MRAPLHVLAPVPGRSVPLQEVPDPVFAGAMVGPGRAVDPERGELTAVAPIGGRVVTLQAHAYVVLDPDGRGVLVHLGIDTVQLAGAGFRLLVAKGDVVAAGTPVVVWNAATVQAGGRSPLCPVIALDASPEDLDDPGDPVDVAAGDELFRWR